MLILWNSECAVGRVRLAFFRLKSDASMQPISQADPDKLAIFTLGYCAPGKSPTIVGILVNDEVQNRLWLEFPDNIEEFIEPDDIEVFGALAHDLRDKAEEMGPSQLLRYLQDTLSNTLLISEEPIVGTISNPSQFAKALSVIFGTEWPGTTAVERASFSIVHTDISECPRVSKKI